MRKTQSLVLFSLFLVLLANCGGTAGRLSPSMVINKCYMMDTEGGTLGSSESLGGSTCDFSTQDQICQDYGFAVGQNYASLKDCLEGCEEIKSRHWLKHAFDGCSNVVVYGDQLCRRFCRQQY